MKRLKEDFPMKLRLAGFVIIFSGVVSLLLLPPKMGTVAVCVIIAGIIIDVIPYLIGTRVYVCPKCKSQFKRSYGKGIVVLVRIEGLGEVLTCPECNKTSFCRMKLVLPSEDKDK